MLVLVGRDDEMCTVMVVDCNHFTRNWVRECILSSNINIGEIVLCNSGEEAQAYIQTNNVDIAFTRIEKEDKTSVALIKAMHKKLLFSIVLGYGACKDFNFLCNMINSGVSNYLQDVFDKAKLYTYLNDAYERYCSSKIQLGSLTQMEKGKREKAYNDLLLRQLIDAYARNAEVGNEKNINKYITLILDIMDNQMLYHSKSMTLELMIMISEKVTKGLIKTDYVLFNTKDCSAIMNFKSLADLKKMVKNYLQNLSRNIYLLSNTDDYKSKSIIAATDFIKSNYHKDISRDDVAASVNLNPSYFSKFFKEQMGESFVAYLRRIRLERSKVMLENTEDAIKVVSGKVGYADTKYFARLFFDYTGYTPCEYRKSIKKLMA